METQRTNSQLTYHVIATQLDESRALVKARGHQMTLNIKKGSGEAGFNAAETLLAALGACILTNVNAIGAKMHLNIRNAHIEFDATRQDEPPVLTEIRYCLVLESSEPLQKLEELYNLSIKWGTVTNTVINGLPLKGTLMIDNQETSNP